MQNNKLKIIFIGTPEFGANVFRKLIEKDLRPILAITASDKPTGRRKTITSSPVKIAAKEYNIPVLQVENISNLKSKVLTFNPDLIVVAGCSKIIPKEILEIPRYGCLNIHPSLLPKYRGCSPIQYAILNNEKETGVTIILMNEKLDQGPIIAASEYKIYNKKLTSKELEKKLTELGAELLIKIIPQWTEGKIKPQPQNENQATYTKILTTKNGFIDWNKSAQEIERHVRAFCDSPGAFCKTNQKIIKIWKVSINNKTENGPKGIPGKTYLAPDNKIAVQCGKDYLIMEEFQFEGKKRVKSEDFLKGNINFIGKILK